MHMTGEAQCRGDGAASTSQEGADQEQDSLVPGGLGKAWFKVGQHGYNSVRKGHRSLLGAE
jgi:hypothetical protein